MRTLVELIVPAVVVFTTLFGVLARGNPKPGGVALFARVGIVGLLLGAALFLVLEKTSAFTGHPQTVVNIYRGLVGGGLLLILFAVFGVVLKRQR
ncbi:MAG TPA: hypothetical protein VN914_07555 [Polyangia bacterium]|nr:hypothetical protein [Polyangia bacterium]